MICDQTRPGFDRAGDGHGVRRMTLDRLDAALSVPFGGRGRRRPSRAVVGDDVFRSAPAEQRETIPADSRRPRLDDALDGACGDGRVDGVSAAFQDLDGRQGRGAVGRGRHPILACGHRSAGKFKIAHGFHLALPDFIGGEAVSFPVRRKRSMKDRSRQTPGRRQQGSLLIYRLHRRRYMVPSMIGTPLDLRSKR